MAIVWNVEAEKINVITLWKKHSEYQSIRAYIEEAKEVK